MRYFNNNTIQTVALVNGVYCIMNHKGGGALVGRSRGVVYG